MNRRKQDRVRRRVTCELVAEDQRFSGIVLDMSPSGIFVQTAAKLARETAVSVRILGAGGDEPIHLRTRVARRKNIPPHLASLSASGIGLEICEAPDAYYEQLGAGPRVGAPSPDANPSQPLQPAEAAPEAEAARFRVRIRHTESSRSRTISVTAPDHDSARARALEQAGEDWEVLGSDAA